MDVSNDIPSFIVDSGYTKPKPAPTTAVLRTTSQPEDAVVVSDSGQGRYSDHNNNNNVTGNVTTITTTSMANSSSKSINGGNPQVSSYDKSSKSCDLKYLLDSEPS
jgi:hypothetical protein